MRMTTTSVSASRQVWPAETSAHGVKKLATAAPGGRSAKSLEKENARLKRLLASEEHLLALTASIWNNGHQGRDPCCRCCL